MRSVECGVRSADCGVQSVESAEFRKMWSVEKVECRKSLLPRYFANNC